VRPNQVSFIPAEIARQGWAFLCALTDVEANSSLLELVYTRPTPNELCGDAIIRMPLDRYVVIREQFSVGFPGLYAVYRVGESDDVSQLIGDLVGHFGLAAENIVSVTDGGGPRPASRQVRDYVTPSREVGETLRPTVLDP
jgi:hypothetical protein